MAASCVCAIGNQENRTSLLGALAQGIRRGDHSIVKRSLALSFKVPDLVGDVAQFGEVLQHFDLAAAETVYRHRVSLAQPVRKTRARRACETHLGLHAAAYVEQDNSRKR